MDGDGLMGIVEKVEAKQSIDMFHNAVYNYFSLLVPSHTLQIPY